MEEWPNREWQVVGPDAWECIEGGLVDVYVDGRLYRRGVVDEVMLDASGFWLAAEGAYLREYIAAPATLCWSEGLDAPQG